MADKKKSEKPAEKVLVARVPILYLSRQYKTGDELPVNNAEMVGAWLEAETAEWTDKAGDEKAVKVVPKTAEPGLSGKAAGGTETDGDDLVGKVPKTAARRKK